MTQPVGEPVDAAPALKPSAVTLRGRYGVVEKFDLAKHSASLWETIKGDDELWTYMWYGPFADREGFDKFADVLAKREDPFAYAILDKSGQALGVATLMEIRPANRVIEVGGIFYAKTLRQTPLATEAQYLLMRYVFEELKYRRHEWKCDALNAPSRRAALRFGFTFEGIFNQHMIIKGRNRDTAWFAMLDAEWPALKRAYESWLAPENFDAQSKQKKKLEQFRV
ncbi:MAG: GNAT family N-acetyltransferase [Xanthobacteraceae bacterium]|nr:GNAT family N-acetyltransferase [Xanthobacteraceae bacterium]